MITPKKLSPGSHVRVVSPSRSLSIISKDVRETASRNLAKLGIGILQALLSVMPIPKGIPVIGGIDCGHTLPMATIPIGGKMKITATVTKNETILKPS